MVVRLLLAANHIDNSYLYHQVPPMARSTILKSFLPGGERNFPSAIITGGECAGVSNSSWLFQIAIMAIATIVARFAPTAWHFFVAFDFQPMAPLAA